MKKLFLVKFIFLLVFLSGCQSINKKSEEIIKKENEKLSKFIGQPESELKIVMGNPDDDTDKIESDLNEMYQAFITGISIGDDIVTPLFTPRKPPGKPRKPPKDRAAEPLPTKSKDDSNFDWV